ncbi:FliM/FliN family flagellar motor switch protein [Rhizobium sp. LC145]|uniref:FliM/FliN family flagellar motor switch protein n=1 Tax=Rhizobium sp. LC145 TaxID=1120688 RepID=UPI000B1DE7B9|nr:FliM/FliN family flagellar motor switch protein [Rhizobium sp. LC145]
MLASPPELPPAGLQERLSRRRTPIACVLGERKVSLHIGEVFSGEDAVAVPVRVGADDCRLHLSAALIEWLQQPLGLKGVLIDEEPPQRALLLELAALDLLHLLESRLSEDIRFGEGGDADLPHTLDLAFVADERSLPLRLELPPQLAEIWADFLDRVQPSEPADLSGLTVELVIEAGSQDLTLDELESLRPGDIVMLATHRTVVVLDGKLIAPVRRQSDCAELDGPFYPKSRRAMVGSLPDLRDNRNGTHILHMVAEFARTTMTLGEIDALKLRQPLPLSYFDETGVDIVVDGRRIGRGELVMIGAGMGVRILHLLPATPV